MKETVGSNKREYEVKRKPDAMGEMDEKETGNKAPFEDMKVLSGRGAVVAPFLETLSLEEQNELWEKIQQQAYENDGWVELPPKVQQKLNEFRGTPDLVDKMRINTHMEEMAKKGKEGDKDNNKNNDGPYGLAEIKVMTCRRCGAGSTIWGEVLFRDDITASLSEEEKKLMAEHDISPPPANEWITLCPECLNTLKSTPHIDLGPVSNSEGKPIGGVSKN